MNTVKKLRKSQISALLIFFFTLIRLLSFADDEQLGFNFTRLDVFYSYKYNVYRLLILIFCALFTFVMFRFIDRCGENIGILCAVVIMDPLFACLQKLPITLLLSCLVLLYTLHILSKKPLLPTEITLVLCCLCAAILSDKSVISFAVLAFLLYVASKSDALSHAKTICMAVGTLLTTVVGRFLHTYVSTHSDSFSSFAAFLNDAAGFAKEKTYIFVLLLLPPLAFGIFLFAQYLQPDQTKKAKGKLKNNKKQQDDDFSATLAMLSIVAYGITVISGIFYDIGALTVANLFIPVAFLVLVYHGNEKAANAANKVNDFIRQHSFLLLLLFILTYYVLLRFVLEDVVFKKIFSFYVVGG